MVLVLEAWKREVLMMEEWERMSEVEVEVEIKYNTKEEWNWMTDREIEVN